MKFTTKRSKVEEILIDFEDGCVVKLTDKNMLGLTYDFIDKVCVVALSNGIEIYLRDVDYEIYTDILKLNMGV